MQVIATITSKFGERGYYGRPVSRVQAYAVDSALDTDADQFSVDIGDPNSELVSILKRDSEVRVNLSAVFRGRTIVPLLSGFADSIGLTHDGVLSLAGRDLSAAAIDDTAVPYNWHNARPDVLIRQQAMERGIVRFGGVLATKKAISPISRLWTDGSESVWALWYRMVRLKQMWIWVDGPGTLYVDHLNYSSSPAYYFGKPTRERPGFDQWIRIIDSNFQKNTQVRVGKIWVFGDTGLKSFTPVKINDPKISDWIKRPLSIVQADSAITTRAAAIKEAHEQIFEGMVGEVEITITVSDDGTLIKQNTVAFLNMPWNGISGEFFIVGVRRMGSDSGFVQQVRLREKKYALTQRQPASPQLKDESANFSTTALGSSLPISKPHWGEFFVVAAKDWHGGFDFNLFLAALLAICDHESSFTNVREPSGGPEWYQNPADITYTVGPDKPLQERVKQWRKDFANDASNPLNPFNPNRDAGVGPMQLTSHSLKIQADRRFGITDEYAGGRWDVASNIYIGAEYLASLQNTIGLPATEASLWIMIAAYNGGPGGYKQPAAQAYMRQIRQAIITSWIPALKSVTKLDISLPANSTKTNTVLPKITPRQIRLIINFAERQVGVGVYQWGAQGELNSKNQQTFDCSGLVYAAYHAAGLSSQIGGRQTTISWWANGRGYGNLIVIPKDQLLPGDMVFFDTPDSTVPQPAHMGIYQGQGQMIDCPHTGATVEENISISEPGRTFVGGLRVPGIWPIDITQSPVSGTP